MVAPGRYIATIDGTDDLTCADMFSGKQSLSMDEAVVNVDYVILPCSYSCGSHQLFKPFGTASYMRACVNCFHSVKIGRIRFR
jgi:hypothetical protein